MNHIPSRPLAHAPAVHVRYGGESQRVSVAQLGLPANADTSAIKTAVARWLEVPVAQLNFHVVERHDNGNFTLRPQAVFG